LKKSGIEKISRILTEEYSNLTNNTSTNLKHKIVFEEIEKISKRNDHLKSQNEIFKEENIFDFIYNIFDSQEKVKLNTSFDIYKYQEEIPFIKLETLKLNLINNKEYQEDALEASIEIEQILLDLHKLGVIVYFNEEVLKNTIIVIIFLFFI
jgi:hypothetical protein